MSVSDCPYCGQPESVAYAMLREVESMSMKAVKRSPFAQEVAALVGAFLAGHESGIDVAHDRLRAEKAGTA